MEKMRMESVDMTEKNIAKIESLFPNCITETLDENGKLTKAINFDLLKQMLSKEIIDSDEAYEFTWVGKKAAIVEANKPIRKTLRPCIEESVDWDDTENIYIKGDNLDVLKLLQESYLGAVKLIYIDPPYNTGSDFIYKDRFEQNVYDFDSNIGMYDDDNNRMFKNSDTNGRFHSDWCSMIYSRLALARNLLTEDGVIIISIDDNEIRNMRMICDELFGESNFISTIVWQKIHSIKNDAKYFSENHEYALVYSKNLNLVNLKLLPRTEEMNSRYKNPDNDPRGPWQSGDLVASGERSNGHFLVTSPITGKKFDVPIGKHWVYSKENLLSLVQDNQIWFGVDGNSFPRKKRFLSEVQDGRTPSTLWLSDDVGHNQTATREVKALFDNKKIFDFPKPVDYIKQFIKIVTDKDSIILDFFSGSATTAHAVIQMNSEDSGHRKFIMVQLEEQINDLSEAKKYGYNTICDIGINRLYRARKQIQLENPNLNNIDTGFRVFTLDDSNMNDVYYSPKDYNQELLHLVESNIKSDRTELDLLFGCLIEWGLPLSLPYNSEEIEGFTVHNYNNGDLVACFNENIPDSVIKYIAKQQPLRAVFRDSSFESSPSKINVGEIFKSLAPDTRVKVI
jgi:hypothetical protein